MRRTPTRLHRAVRHVPVLPVAAHVHRGVRVRRRVHQHTRPRAGARRGDRGRASVLPVHAHVVGAAADLHLHLELLRQWPLRVLEIGQGLRPPLRMRGLSQRRRRRGARAGRPGPCARDRAAPRALVAAAEGITSQPQLEEEETPRLVRVPQVWVRHRLLRLQTGRHHVRPPLRVRGMSQRRRRRRRASRAGQTDRTTQCPANGAGPTGEA